MTSKTNDLAREAVSCNAVLDCLMSFFGALECDELAIQNDASGPFLPAHSNHYLEHIPDEMAG